MGKLTGFMEYERHEPPGRDPKTRVRDWLEFHDQDCCTPWLET